MAAKELKAKFPNVGIEFGMAGEFNLGMHGKLEFEGQRIAGLYPHQQVKMAEKAGVDISRKNGYYENFAQEPGQRR